MKLVAFVFLLAVSAVLAYSASKPTYEIAPSEYPVDYTPSASESMEDSDEDDSDEEKTSYVKPTVASYNSPVSNYVRTYDEPKYLINFSTPNVPIVQVAPAAAPAYKYPVSSYDRPALLPYWLRPRT